MGEVRRSWRGWIRYWRMTEPSAELHYDLRGPRTMTAWIETPLANMGFWQGLDTGDPDAIEAANHALFDMVAGEAGIESGDRVLDAGAGFAVNAIRLADRHRARVTGVNVSTVQTDIGIRLVHQAGMEDQIELIVGDATRLPIPDGTIDRVVSIEAAFHFSSREEFFAEAFRVLRPGGTIALVDLVPLPPTGAVQRRAARLLSRALAIPSSNFYGVDEYIARVVAAGFRDVRAESIVEQTYTPFRRWIGRTIARQMRGKHPMFAVPSMVYLAYPIDYIRLRATKPSAPPSGDRHTDAHHERTSA
jgi:cyclopropane fatty-acyl-phospholipid synthase-like methyltransferase